jgi:8-oxo-dGTP diphosphatase
MALQTHISSDEQFLHHLVEQAVQDGIQKFVVGAVVDKDGQVLLLQRHPEEAFMAGLIELPSGTVEPEEPLLHALARELHEETGLETTCVESFIGSFDYRSGSGKKTRQFNFRVHAEGEIVLSHEHSHYYFIVPSAQALQGLTISPETQRTLLTSA